MAATDSDVDDVSRRLLTHVDEVKRLESEKREHARSSDEFHALADEVEQKAREVFQLADTERDLGDEDSPIPEERAETTPRDWSDGR